MIDKFDVKGSKEHVQLCRLLAKGEKQRLMIARLDSMK